MLLLRREHLAQMLAHAHAAAPEEACGVLGGRDEGPLRRVEVVHACRNVAPRPRWEYVAHPQDQLRAFLDIEDSRGLDVVGFYHSHPLGPQGPSSVDAARANYPGVSYVVVWLAPAEGWGSWRWAPPKGFEAEPVQVEASPGGGG